MVKKLVLATLSRQAGCLRGNRCGKGNCCHNAIQRHLMGSQKFVRRVPGRDKLAHLQEDLEYRRRKEIRFLHKLLVWPKYTDDPRRSAGSNPLKGKFDTVPLSYGMKYIRIRFLQTALQLGCDLKAARKFNAAADMKQNFNIIYHHDNHECDLGEALRMGEVTFVSKDQKQEIHFDYQRGAGRAAWNNLIIGDVVRAEGNRPLVQITDTTTGKMRLYDLKDKVYGKKLGGTARTWEPGMERTWLLPKWLDRVPGMHNGSAIPEVYKNISSNGKPPAMRAQLDEVKMLEMRETKFKALLHELVPRRASKLQSKFSIDGDKCHSLCKKQNLRDNKSLTWKQWFKQLWEVNGEAGVLEAYLSGGMEDYPLELCIIKAECEDDGQDIVF